MFFNQYMEIGYLCIIVVIVFLDQVVFLLCNLMLFWDYVMLFLCLFFQFEINVYFQGWKIYYVLEVVVVLVVILDVGVDLNVFDW